MIERIKWWIRKPVSASFLWILFGAVCGFGFLWKLISSVYDYDVFFLIATGREIVENGIPGVNPWAIDTGLSFIAQQWLYAVVLYLFYALAGKLGMMVFLGIQILLLYLVLHKMMQLMDIGGKWQIGILFVTTVLSQKYLFSVRPETITLLLLACQCLVMEKALRTSQYQWFWFLPVIMLLEINLHGSMWLFHFCILAAYLVPVFWLSKTDDFLSSELRRNLWLCMVPAILMVGVMFLNPYGVDGILYIINANTAGTFKFVRVTEMLQPAGLSWISLVLVVCGALLLFCYRAGFLSGVSVNLFAGFGLLAGIASRNSMFLFFPVFFLLRDACFRFQYHGLAHLRWKWYCQRITCVVLMVGAAVSGGRLVSLMQSTSGNDLATDGPFPAALYEVCQYIEEQDGLDAKVFTGFDTGAYLEFYGFHQVYLDARPELYMKNLNGQKNILAEYSRYCLFGVTTRFYPAWMPMAWGMPVQEEEMEAWISGYDFDYLVVVPSVEVNLAGWLLNDETYQVVDACCREGIVLYERKAGVK